MRRTSTALSRYENEELRAMTKSPRARDSSVMMSSVMPSAKYRCSGSPLMLVKGRTAIEGLAGNESEIFPAGCQRIHADFERSHRVGDVLKHNIAHIFEGMAALAAHFVVNLA